MIVDCFIIADEVDLLCLRLETLWDIVDEFVAVEVGETHSGNPKPVLKPLLETKLSRFSEKLTFITVDRFPTHLGPFEREWWQRNLAKDLLDRKLSEGDLLLYGDVDEIPRPEALRDAIGLVSEGDSDRAFLALDFFYVWFNFQETSGKFTSPLGEYRCSKSRRRCWLGPGVWRYGGNKLHGEWNISDLRTSAFCNVRSAPVIENGGWHFSYVSNGLADSGDGIERLSRKLDMTAHQEFNTSKTKAKFHGRVLRGKDPLGRRGVRFKVVTDYSQLPEVVQDNLQKYASQLITTQVN